MKTAITAAEANRSFSRLLRDVREGRSFVITAHGRPVARMLPFSGDDRNDRVRAAARELLFDRLRAQETIDIGRWTREEAHERSR